MPENIVPPVITAPWATQPAAEQNAPEAPETVPELPEESGEEQETAPEAPVKLTKAQQKAADKAAADKVAAEAAPQPNVAKAVPMEAPRVAKAADFAAMNPTAEPEETVTVTVPKAFRLCINSHQVVQYGAGIQEMPKSHAAHWYAKAHGVQVYAKPTEE